MYIYISNNIYVDINQSRSKCYTVQKDNKKNYLFLKKKFVFIIHLSPLFFLNPSP